MNPDQFPKTATRRCGSKLVVLQVWDLASQLFPRMLPLYSRKLVCERLHAHGFGFIAETP